MNKERAPEPQGWIVARRFPNQTAALRAFTSARNLLLTEDLDASVLRFLIEGRSHVAVLGELALPNEAEQKMRGVIEQGSEPATLPDAVADQLRVRRKQFKATGLEYLERRTQIGPGGGA